MRENSLVADVITRLSKINLFIHIVVQKQIILILSKKHCS